MLSSLIFIVAFLRSYVAVTVHVDPNTSAAGISVSLINDTRASGRNQVDANRWKLENSEDNALNNWGLQIKLDAETYGFKSGASDSSVTVSVDADVESNEADLFVGVGIGDQYVTYAFDLDGGLWLRSNAEENKGGVWTFPQCSTGTMASGDVSTLLLEENLDPSINYPNAVRDALCGGDDEDAQLLTSTRNNGALPVTLQLTSDDIAQTLEITFSTPTYATPFSCTFDVSGASVVGQDLDIFLNNDAGGSLEIVAITSVDVTASNAGTANPTTLEFIGTCDNFLTVEMATDGDDTNYVDVTSLLTGDPNNWTETKRGTLTGITSDTKLRLTCVDVGVAGGLIASIGYGGVYYSTNGDEDNYGYYALVSATSGRTTTVTSAYPSWPAYVNELTSEPYNAQWTWTCGETSDWTSCPASASSPHTEVYVLDLALLLSEDTCDDSSIASFDWDELMTTGAAAKPAVISFNLSVEDSSLSLDIVVALTYEGRSSADEKGAVFGTTYVLDFEDFDAHSSSISAPGTCSNRNGNDFTGGDFSAWWDYSLSPADDLGSAAYLAYPPPNAVHGEWTVAAAADDECGVVVYTGRFTWNDLTACTDATGTAAYITARDDADDDGKLKLEGTFYVNVVSPYAPTSDGESGFYRVYQLISQPFVISVNKNLQVLQSAGINLFTTSVIAVYKDSGASEFKLVVLTESAEYLQLSRTGLGAGLAMFSSSSAENSAPQAEEFTVALTSENGDANGIGCLNNKDYICSQLWQIEAPGDCSDDQSQYIDFSGNYTLQFTPVCRSAAELTAAGVANSTALNAYCAVWLAGHPEEAAGVGLTATLQWRDQECDPLLYEVQFEADMAFYTDDAFSSMAQADTLYQVGEGRIYVEVDTEFPTAAFDVFDSTLLNVWICTFDPLNGPLLPIEPSELSGGCFSANIDGYSADADFGADNLYAYHIYDSQSTVSVPEVVAFDSVGHPLDATTGDAINNIVRFSFVVPPQIARDTLYIHAQIEVSLIDADNGRRRMPVVTIGDGWPAGANQMEHFLGKVGVSGEPQPYRPLPGVQQPHYEPVSKINVPGLDTGAYTLSLQSPWMMAIVGLLVVLLTFNIVYMCYSRACRGGGGNGGARVSFGGRSKRRYKVVNVNDSEMGDSEAEAMNVVSE